MDRSIIASIVPGEVVAEIRADLDDAFRTERARVAMGQFREGCWQLGAAAHETGERLEEAVAAARLCTASIEEPGGVDQGLARLLVDGRRWAAILGMRALGRLLCFLRVGHGLNFRLALRCERLQKKMRRAPLPVTGKDRESFSGRSA